MTFEEKLIERFGHDIGKLLRRRACPSMMFVTEISDNYCNEHSCVECWNQEYKGEKPR